MHTYSSSRWLIIFLLVFMILSVVLPAQAVPKLITIGIQDKYVITDRVRLHYVQSGAGQPVVLLHGNYGTVQDFIMSPLFLPLAAKYQVLAFDRPGYGESKLLGQSDASPEIQARIIHHALGKLGISRPLLVAHSWSGALALSYALQFPNDLSGIVLLGAKVYNCKDVPPKPSYYLAKVPILGNMLAFCYKIFGRHMIQEQLEQAFFPNPAPRLYVDKFLSSILKISQLKITALDKIAIISSMKRMSKQYGKINLPVVIVVGDRDQILSPQKQSYLLHKAIPTSQLVVLHNAGHELQFTRPRGVMSASKQAMARVVSPMSLPLEPVLTAHSKQDDIFKN